MHPDDSFRPTGMSRDLGDGDRARIAGEYGLRPGDFVEVAENSVFEILVLRRGLDDECGVFRTFQLLTQLDSSERFRRCFRGDRSFFHLTVEILPDRGPTALERLTGDVDHRHRISRLREYVRNAVSHLPGSDDDNSLLHSISPGAAGAARRCRSQLRTSRRQPPIPPPAPTRHRSASRARHLPPDSPAP